MTLPPRHDDDPHRLARFVLAQHGVYEAALDEVRSGRKHSHWMWYVFPQIAGLGESEISRRYAISGAAEARAYLAHPVLGPRLEAICGALLDLRGRSAHEVFGTPDDLKLRSCATLFDAVTTGDTVYARVLERYFDGERDELTLGALRRDRGG